MPASCCLRVRFIGVMAGMAAAVSAAGAAAAAAGSFPAAHAEYKPHRSADNDKRRSYADNIVNHIASPVCVC